MVRRRSSEDLFEDSRMSFGEHLEELRGALVRSLIGIGIGCVVGFLVADKVVSFLEVPLRNALGKFRIEQANRVYIDRLGYFPPEMRNRMDNGELAPQTVFVDPGEIVKAIRSISPESLEKIDLTPYQFRSSDIAIDNVPEICRQLVEPETADQQLVDKLRSLNQALTESNLATLRSIADISPASETSRIELVQILNELIDRPEIHQSAGYVEWLRKPSGSVWNLFDPPEDNALEQMKAQVDANDNQELSRRLNRVLVAKTFAPKISFPDIDLFPIVIWSNIAVETQSLSPHEPFMTWLKAAIVTGLIISSPWVFIQIWIFVAAGLYPHEQKYIYLYLPISIALFVFGVCLAFFFVFEPVLGFLFKFNASMGINPQVRIGEWLSFVLFLPLGFGIAFQLPLVMLFMNRIGLVSVDAYVGKWRIAVLIISVMSMLLTPSDPISMIMLGVPLTFLYFFGIGLCKWMPKPQNPFGEVAEV